MEPRAPEPGARDKAENSPEVGSELVRRVRVETPEHVRIDFVLADLGTRVAALSLDVGIIVVVGVILVLALLLGLFGGFDFLREAAATVLVTIWSASHVFLLSVYLMLFEGLDGGRTPGKRMLGMRVVHTGGEPLSFKGAVLRNVILLIDLLLGGAFFILFNRRAQRLGDIVAGTMVVRDSAESTVVTAPESGLPANVPGLRGQAGAVMAREQGTEWTAYEVLVAKGRKQGLKNLTEREIQEFGQRYRGIAADLERARTYGASRRLVGTLQELVGAGHNLLYSRWGRAAVSPWHWLAVGFPSTVRRHWRPNLLAVVLLFGPILPTYLAVRADPVLGRAWAGPVMMTRAENTEKGNPDATYLANSNTEYGSPALASEVGTNNVSVALNILAGGATAGILTVLVLLYNGILLGAVFGAYANTGVLPVILAFVFPHGFIELVAICIGGSAGFVLGAALWMPGRRSRAEALIERGKTALSLLGGTVLMLVLAAVIEGFYSPTALPAAAKFWFGGVTAVLLALYFGLAGTGVYRKLSRTTQQRVD